MKILAVDTTGTSCGVALLMDGVVQFEQSRALHRTHSTEVMPMIDAALGARGLTPADIDLYACVVGPGSFTGVRIGVSTVRGLAHATGKPCLPVNALEALAFANRDPAADILCPILDARSRQVYGAAFAPADPPRRLLADSAGPLSEYLDRVGALGQRLLFCGDAALRYQEDISAYLGGRARFAGEEGFQIQPAAVARLALRADPASAVPYMGLMPHYVRAPQAERERLAREDHSGA